MKAKRKNQDKTVVTEQSPLGLRAAARLWIELGRPERHAASLEQWSVDMQVCYEEFRTWHGGVEEDSATAYGTFKWFLVWVCRLGVAGNKYTAEYLRLAHNPAATLRKNMMMIRHYWEQFNEKDLLPMMKRQYEKEKENAVPDDIEQMLDDLAEMNKPDWRCPNCSWNSAGELTRECQDCREEWMMNHEPPEPTVLELGEDAFKTDWEIEWEKEHPDEK